MWKSSFPRITFPFVLSSSHHLHLPTCCSSSSLFSPFSRSFSSFSSSSSSSSPSPSPSPSPSSPSPSPSSSTSPPPPLVSFPVPIGFEAVGVFGGFRSLSPAQYDFAAIRSVRYPTMVTHIFSQNTYHSDNIKYNVSHYQNKNTPTSSTDPSTLPSPASPTGNSFISQRECNYLFINGGNSHAFSPPSPFTFQSLIPSLEAVLPLSFPNSPPPSSFSPSSSSFVPPPPPLYLSHGPSHLPFSHIPFQHSFQSVREQYTSISSSSSSPLPNHYDTRETGFLTAAEVFCDDYKRGEEGGKGTTREEIMRGEGKGFLLAKKYKFPISSTSHLPYTLLAYVHSPSLLLPRSSSPLLIVILTDYPVHYPSPLPSMLLKSQLNQSFGLFNGLWPFGLNGGDAFVLMSNGATNIVNNEKNHTTSAIASDIPSSPALPSLPPHLPTFLRTLSSHSFHRRITSDYSSTPYKIIGINITNCRAQEDADTILTLCGEQMKWNKHIVPFEEGEGEKQQKKKENDDTMENLTTVSVVTYRERILSSLFGIIGQSRVRSKYQEISIRIKSRKKKSKENPKIKDKDEEVGEGAESINLLTMSMYQQNDIELDMDEWGRVPMSDDEKTLLSILKGKEMIVEIDMGGNVNKQYGYHALKWMYGMAE